MHLAIANWTLCGFTCFSDVHTGIPFTPKSSGAGPLYDDLVNHVTIILHYLHPETAKQR